MNNYFPTQQQYAQAYPNISASSPQAQSPTFSQPLFPQPNGNVYSINNTLEVANIPSGVGLSVALCLSEGLMYIY